MSNKQLAILGIIAYALMVLSSGVNEQGEFISPWWVILLAGTLRIVFVIIATIRLWRIFRISSVILASTFIIFFAAEASQILSFFQNSKVIFISNLLKTISLLAYFWAIFLLFKASKKNNNE